MPRISVTLSVAKMIVDVRVNRFTKSVIRDSWESVLGSLEILLEMYESKWYHGSRGDEENNRRTTGASTALSYIHLFSSPVKWNAEGEAFSLSLRSPL